MLDIFEVFTQNRFYLELYLGSSSTLGMAAGLAKQATGLDGYFMEVSGLKYEHEAVDFWEVTPQKWGSKNLLGNANASVGRLFRTRMPAATHSKIDITLKRGMNISESMRDWIEAVREGEWADRRRDGDLVVLDQSGFEKARFRFLGAWPKSYAIEDAKVDGESFQVETVVLACDDFFRVTYTNPAELARMAASAATGLATTATSTAAQTGMQTVEESVNQEIGNPMASTQNAIQEGTTIG